jgi:hypothetical protein
MLKIEAIEKAAAAAALVTNSETLTNLLYHGNIEATFDLCQQPGWSGESIYLQAAGEGFFGEEAKSFHELQEDERIAFNFLHHTARFFGALVEPEPMPVADPLPADPSRGFERVHDEDDDLTGRVGDDKEPWRKEAEARAVAEAEAAAAAEAEAKAKAEAEAAAAAEAEAKAKAEAEAAAAAAAEAKAKPTAKATKPAA